MIDIESEVFSFIEKELKANLKKIEVLGEEIRAPSVFPCVTVVEADNYSVRSTRDSASNENHADVMYEVNVYTNRANGKKSECKKIFAVVDSAFLDLGFTRTMRNPISMDDASKYRLTARYTARVSKDKTIYSN